MKKLNSTMYHKLLLQAEEAKDREMVKLSSGILDAIGPFPEEEKLTYNFEELEQDVYNNLWKMATCVIKYHDLESADAEKISSALESLSTRIVEELEYALGVDTSKIGPLEEKVPGENK